MNPKEQCRLAIEGSTRPDVLARRRARATLDPLVYRAWCAALWKSGPWPFDGVSAWVFYRNQSFRRYLMPGVRDCLDARRAARRAQHSAGMAESARRWRHAKALKKAGALPLFEDMA